MSIGWNCYDQDFASAAHVDAVAAQKPPIVRWFVSIDRHGRSDTPFDWQGRYAAAFAAVAAAGTRLVVQLAMKSPDWTGNDWSGDQGCRRWKAGPRAGWFASDDVWAQFVSSLQTAIPATIPTVWGCWNEPDWRNALWGQSRISPTDPWYTGQILWWTAPPSHFMGWTGGHAHLQSMRARFPDLSWTTDGVSVNSGQWPDLVRDDPTISVVDVHSYQGESVDQHYDWVCRHADALGVGRPVFIGEYADRATGSPPTAEWADRTLVLHDRLAAELGDRWWGICSHTVPPVWQPT